MKNIPKTKKQYYCKHCGNKIDMITALYGQSQCKQCQNRKYFIAKKELYKEYISKNKSITEIAKIYKCCYGTIYKWLLNYHIRIKSKRETHLGRKRPEHSLRMMGDKNPMAGTHRPKSVRDKISKGRIGKYLGRNSAAFGRKPSHRCSYGHGGRYKKTWFKSSYEIAYAKYLTKNHIKWQYEPKIFDLGETTYRPDFYLLKTKQFIEIKGYWTKEAIYKFELFKILYPNIKILVLERNDLLRRKINVN
jgi:hypothetical protein